MRTRVRGPRDREDVEGWMKAILSMIRRDSSGELLRLITCVLARVLGRTVRTLGVDALVGELPKRNRQRWAERSESEHGRPAGRTFVSTANDHTRSVS